MTKGGGPKQKGEKWRIAVLLCSCCLCFAWGASAQSGPVPVSSSETTLKQALEGLQSRTGYMPVVNYDNIEPSRRVVLSSDNLSADELLRQVLSGTGFTFELVGRRVLIVPEPPKIDDGEGAFSAMWSIKDDDDDSVEVEMITFRIGSSVPELRFMDNVRVFEKLDSELTDSAMLARIDHISVTAASSPGGNTDNNERLAVRRALETRNYLSKRYPQVNPAAIHVFSVGEEWTGLRRLVEEDLHTPNRAEVLDLLDNVPDEAKRDTLRTVGDGRAWRYITAGLLPKLRGAADVALHFKDALSQGRVDTVGVAHLGQHGLAMLESSGVQRVEILAAKPAPPREEPAAEPVPEIRKKPLFAIKTNLAADVLVVPNIEIEVPIGQRWSLAAEAFYSPWMFAGGTLEGRRWWRDGTLQPVLTGWFTGIYFGGGVHEMGLRATAPGDFFHAGLSGGYAHAVNRSGNLRMEYSLGVGYLWGTRIVEDNLHEKFNLFAPTRAKVSLVFMLEGIRKK